MDNTQIIETAQTDEVFKHRVRKFNNIMKLYFICYIIYFIVIVWFNRNTATGFAYKISLILPFTLFFVFQKQYRSSTFKARLAKRDDYRQYADSFIFVRALYDNKTMWIVIGGFTCMLFVAQLLINLL